MAADVQVQCIKKRNRTNHYERIQSIGGINPDGGRWKLSEDDAIAGISDDRVAILYVNYTICELPD